MFEQVPEDVPVGYVVGSVSGSDQSDADNLIASNRGLHVTYMLNSLITDVIDGAFDIDRNTGSLVVARQLDREVQGEYRLEIRALDTTATNNPQSSAVTVKVEITDVNDNAPRWTVDPIVINVIENSPIGTSIFNFTATDNDAGLNGEIQYKLIKQVPSDRTTFAVDPLTGTLSQLLPIDYEELNEYVLVVQATDQSLNETERLSTSVTAHILVTDANDNAPTFISPSTDDSIALLNEAISVGHVITHVVAVDKDSGDNGRITYAIVSGNEDEIFQINSETGHVELVKPLIGNDTNELHQYYSNGAINTGKYSLVVSATDHGLPTPQETRVTMQIIVQGSTSNPPRFTESVYHVNISENIPIGNFVIRVHAKSFQADGGKSMFIHIYLLPLSIESIAYDRFDTNA